MSSTVLGEKHLDVFDFVYCVFVFMQYKDDDDSSGGECMGRGQEEETLTKDATE